MTQEGPAAGPDRPLPAQNPCGGVSGPANPAQGNTGPFGWVLIDSVGGKITSPVRTREEAAASVRAWDERCPGRAGRYSVAQLLPDGDPLAVAQDEIERRITECEGHRALIDAVLAERAAGRALDDLHPYGGWAVHAELIQRASAAIMHRRAVVDSIGDA